MKFKSARIVTATILAITCYGNTWAQSSVDTDAIRGLLLDQQDAWNEGDYEGFMEGYWKSDSLTFASSGTYNRGWQTTLDNYKVRYPDRGAMGTLTFTLFDIQVLSETHGFVFGKYELERTHDRPSGVFTLLLNKFDDGWRIVFDHTSTKTPAETEAQTEN
jgi:ketosteroid isomerase-like protein